MKKHLLPALISLAFLSPFAMAEQANPGTPPPPPPATATMESMTLPPPPMTGMSGSGMTGQVGQADYDAMMQKRMEKRKEMQALWQKIQEAKTPEERQKLMEEQRKMMQSHQETMRKEMQDGMPPPWAYGPPPGYGRMGGGRPQMMGMGYDDMDEEPPMRPRHRMMNEGRGGDGGCRMMDKMGGGQEFQQHQATMEKRMENIEKLLERIADSLAAKQK
jgi:hypothetical protein